MQLNLKQNFATTSPEDSITTKKVYTINHRNGSNKININKSTISTYNNEIEKKKLFTEQKEQWQICFHNKHDYLLFGRIKSLY